MTQTSSRQAAESDRDQLEVPLTLDGPSPRVRGFFEQHTDDHSPCLVIDLDVVADRYQRMKATFPEAGIYYAVKANPAPELVRLLVELGCRFDVASPGEIDICIEAGAEPTSMSYGNTIKKADDIVHAYEAGIRLYAFDSASELEKLAEFAPGSSVFCRMLVSSDGASWPLGRKFGCTTEMAADLLRRAGPLGLLPAGVSFHVGSQQVQPTRWLQGIAQAGQVFAELAEEGIPLWMLNMGGGFPANYVESAPPLSTYRRAIDEALDETFGSSLRPTIVLEPGRYIAADAGVLRTSVVLVSRKSYDADKRWVYLDAGRYGGLAETEGEAIKYRLATSHDGGPTGPVVLAGPTCDSADVLYQDTVYDLPLDLDVGDHIDVLSAGAYTQSYASVAFNGFEPLTIYCIGESS